MASLADCLIIYEYGPTKERVLLEPTLLPACLPSLTPFPPALPPPFHHHNHPQHSELYSPESSRENQLPSITNADETSKLTGAA